MANEIIVGVIATLTGTLIGFFGTRKKNAAEANKLQAEAELTVSQMWQNLANGLEERLDNVQKQNDQLIKQNIELLQELEIIRKENKQLKGEMKNIREQLQQYKQ